MTVPRVTEKAWQATILEAAQVLGYLCFHAYDSRRSEPGFPDLLCVRDGRVVVIECKTETGRVTPAQATWLALLATVPGINVMIARPSQWDDVESVLKGEAA